MSRLVSSLGMGVFARSSLENTKEMKWLSKSLHLVVQNHGREKEVYNSLLSSHDNILRYLASDIFHEDGEKEHWLITEYHPHGSLYDRLNRLTFDPLIMMRMAISMCRELTHILRSLQVKPKQPSYH